MPFSTYTREWWAYLTEDSRYQGLDLLRAIAIVAVVVWHHDPEAVRLGWIGVNLFFILSGFLIGSILLKGFDTDGFRMGSYLSSRFLRIYPLYAAAVAFYIFTLYMRVTITGAGTGLQIAALHAVFLQTLAFDLWRLDLPFYMPTWSLVVEVMFYITIPFILAALYRLRVVWLGLVALAAAFLWLRFAISATLDPEDPNWHFYYFLRPYFRYDELLFGVGVAYAVHRGHTALRGALLIAGAVGISWLCHHIWNIPKADQFPSMALLTWQSVVFPTLLASAFAAIVYGMYDKRWSCRLVNVIARLAYPLYLGHTFLLPFTKGWISYLGLSFLVAVVASYAIEYPFIRMYKNARSSAHRVNTPLGTT